MSCAHTSFHLIRQHDTTPQRYPFNPKQINITTNLPPTLYPYKQTNKQTHTICPKDTNPGNLYVAGETKKTITLTYAPASALCGVAKLFAANTLRWCVCVAQCVRARPIVWGHLLHDVSICVSSNLVCNLKRLVLIHNQVLICIKREY